MHVKIKRKAKSRWHKDWVEMAQEAVEWVCRELRIHNEKAYVKVILKSDFEEVYAGAAMTLKPFSRFAVILNEPYCLDQDHIFETIFHEFVHIRQELHQGLYLENDYSEAHFEGMVYKYSSPAQFDKAYYDQPWEVEARKVGAKLLKKYKKLLTP